MAGKITVCQVDAQRRSNGAKAKGEEQEATKRNWIMGEEKCMLGNAAVRKANLVALLSKTFKERARETVAAATWTRMLSMPVNLSLICVACSKANKCRRLSEETLLSFFGVQHEMETYRISGENVDSENVGRIMSS